MTHRQCTCGTVVSWWVGSCPRCWSDLTEPLIPPAKPKPSLLDSTIIARLPEFVAALTAKGFGAV